MNTANPTPKKEQETLSPESRRYIEDTRHILSIIMHIPETLDDVAVSDLALNEELLRTCIIAILSMEQADARTSFVQNPGDVPSVLRRALERAPLTDEEKKELRKTIDTIEPADAIHQTPLVNKLNLLATASLTLKMSEGLYAALKNNQDAFRAHAYLNFSES